jgi:hypothetical protein
VSKKPNAWAVVNNGVSSTTSGSVRQASSSQKYTSRPRMRSFPKPYAASMVTM